MKKIISFSAVLGAVAPMFVFAAGLPGGAGSGADAWTILAKINGLLNFLLPILISLAVVYFVWGVIQYTVSGDEEKKKKARGMIIQGLIGLFVIIAFWGIIAILVNTFEVGPSNILPGAIPCIPGPGVTCN